MHLDVVHRLEGLDQRGRLVGAIDRQLRFGCGIDYDERDRAGRLAAQGVEKCLRSAGGLDDVERGAQAEIVGDAAVDEVDLSAPGFVEV
jgi:hypothetical protein